MIKEKNRLDIDKRLKEAKGWDKFRIIVGGLCFIVGATFVLIHLGFIEDESIHVSYQPKQFLSRISLWMWNLVLGGFGGVLLGHPKYLSGLVSGVVAAFAITGTTILYLSWRDSIFVAEIIIPILSGLVGIFTYRFLVR